MLDLEKLLKSFSDDAPSGQNLEYDADFIALEIAKQPGEERVIGDAVIPAEDPDYGHVVKLAIPLLERTKDLRVAVTLANATLCTKGLPEFEEVLRYIRSCLEEFWDSVHPQLDEDDDDEPTMRVNAILGLTNRDTVLRALRLTPLTDSPAFGRFSLRDLELASGEVTTSSDTETVPAPQTISAGFQDEDTDRLAQTVAAANAVQEHAKAIGEIFDARIGTLGPELDPLLRMIHDIRKHLAVYTHTPVPDDVEDKPEIEATMAAPIQRGVGTISTPNDVVNALDRIVEYYARNEPSSPLPILLTRARRLVSADFITIMKDMAPLGVDNISLIGGLEQDDDEDNHDDD